MTAVTDATAMTSTRDLARAWIAAVRESGLGGAKALALTTADFKLNLPRSLSPHLGVAGLDTSRDQLDRVEAAVRALFDLGQITVGPPVYDIFQGDRGGVQFPVRLQPRGGTAFDTVVSLTFARAGEALSAVWVHTDTSDILLALGGR
jgi:sensor domain CHASE-containing protein